MKKAIIPIIIITILIVTLTLFLKPEEQIQDENVLYKEKFNDTILKFVKYDYALGQNILVGVERSTNQGKSYKKITQDLVTVSEEARFIFLNESLGFIISTGYIMRSNNFAGLQVTIDGGKTFQKATFIYENEDIDLITIESFPLQEEDVLKLKCSIYELKVDKSGYQNTSITFISRDQGITWSLE